MTAGGREPDPLTFSALTTIGSLCSLSMSSHPGTASMGFLLTIAISLKLVCTLLVLPALLTLFGPAAAREEPKGRAVAGARPRG